MRLNAKKQRIKSILKMASVMQYPMLVCLGVSIFMLIYTFIDNSKPLWLLMLFKITFTAFAVFMFIGIVLAAYAGFYSMWLEHLEEKALCE